MGRKTVLLPVARKRPYHGGRVRLAGRCGPLSEGDANWESGERYVAFFNIDEVLAFLNRVEETAK